MRTVTVSAPRPAQVAWEVEKLVARGWHSFVITSIDHGGMLDLERLGAARYAAGLHSRVVLDEAIPVSAAAVR